MEDSKDSARERALAYLETLDEGTMRLAWGEVSEERRTRLVVAAVLFGRRFEERFSEGVRPQTDDEVQRLLMRLMNDVIRDLAGSENLSETAATEFLSDVETRDRVLEMNEVIETYETREACRDGGSNPQKSLDALLRESIEKRREKAVWSDHWTSG